MLTQTNDDHRTTPAGKIPLVDFFHTRSTALTQEAVRFACGWRKQLLTDMADRNLVRDMLHSRMRDFVGVSVRELPASGPLTIRAKRRRGAA